MKCQAATLKSAARRHDALEDLPARKSQPGLDTQRSKVKAADGVVKPGLRHRAYEHKAISFEPVIHEEDREGRGAVVPKGSA